MVEGASNRRFGAGQLRLEKTIVITERVRVLAAAYQWDFDRERDSGHRCEFSTQSWRSRSAPVSYAESTRITSEASPAFAGSSPSKKYLSPMEGAIVYRHACALGCEGIVSKLLTTGTAGLLDQGQESRCASSEARRRRGLGTLMSDDCKIYVDAEQSAILNNGAGVLTDCATCKSAFFPLLPMAHSAPSVS